MIRYMEFRMRGEVIHTEDLHQGRAGSLFYEPIPSYGVFRGEACSCMANIEGGRVVVVCIPFEPPPEYNHPTPTAELREPRRATIDESRHGLDY